MSAIHPILLCGGSGTRLWPLSRESFPKQFAPLTDERSLFQQTAIRFRGDAFAKPLAVTSDKFRFIVAKQLKEIKTPASAILIEPEPKNTAPAILAAAEWLAQQSGDALMLATPTDHLVPSPEKMCKLVQVASKAAEDGCIVLLGIQPDRAETGYGWLQIESLPEKSSGPVPVKEFAEKPDLKAAKRMLAGGDHLWNSGVFLFKASTIIEAVETHARHLVEPVRSAVSNARQDLEFIRLAPNHWSGVKSISIDRAVMESASNLRVMAFDAGWSDLGDWESIWRTSNKNGDGLATRGPVTAIDCRNTLLRSENPGQKLVGIGLENVIAVSMPDAVLITGHGFAQQVKDAVEDMRAEGLYQADEYLRDYRPWGHFETLAQGSNHKVKRITVNPGGKLSLQSHRHRAEHWVIVEGTGKVTVGKQEQVLTENQSIFIPLGEVHRLENPGKARLTLIEVQTGTYFGEDDIIRYDDVYSRA